MGVSERYVNNEELEAWIEKRFGPNSPFNRQLVRDLLDWGVRAALADKSDVDVGEPHSRVGGNLQVSSCVELGE